MNGADLEGIADRLNMVAKTLDAVEDSIDDQTAFLRSPQVAMLVAMHALISKHGNYNSVLRDAASIARRYGEYCTTAAELKWDSASTGKPSDTVTVELEERYG